MDNKNSCTKCGSDQEMLTEDVNAPKRCAGCGETKKNPLAQDEDFYVPQKK